MAIELPRDAGDPITSPELLRDQLRLRLQHHLQTNGFRAAITIVGFDGSRSEVLRRDLEHPERAVLGFTLPDRHAALGVIASSVIAAPPQRSYRDAALAVGVNRAGQVVSLLATKSDVIDTKEPRGWLLDACLRAVDLPTPPTDVAPLSFSIALWLDRLMVALVSTQSVTPLSWADAVALSPVPRRWRSTDPVDLGTTLGSITQSWKSLRKAAALNAPSPIGVAPAIAEWMDDPMFARWCMGFFPDVASLRGDVEFLAPAPVAEGIEVALRAAWLVAAG